MLKSAVSERSQLTFAKILIFFAVIAAYGMATNFIPNDTYALFMQCLTTAITVLFSIYFYPIHFKKKKKARGNSGNKSRSYTFLLVPAGPFVLLLFSLVWGLPSILHGLLAEDAEESYKVYAPRHAYINTSGSCKGGLAFESKLLIKNRVCRIPRDIYESVSDGDTIIVSGKKSMLGFSYNSFKDVPVRLGMRRLADSETAR